MLDQAVGHTYIFAETLAPSQRMHMVLLGVNFRVMFKVLSALMMMAVMMVMVLLLLLLLWMAGVLTALVVVWMVPLCLPRCCCCLVLLLQLFLRCWFQPGLVDLNVNAVRRLSW